MFLKVKAPERHTDGTTLGETVTREKDNTIVVIPCVEGRADDLFVR